MFKSIRVNKLKSAFIVLFVFAILLAILLWVGYIFQFGFAFVVLAFVFSIGTTWASYYYSDKIILKMTNARKATKDENLALVNILDSLMLSSGIPTKPELYVIDDKVPNAFATGRNPEHSIVCVTSGLLEKLSYYELEGVIAHEMAHIKNYDILLSTVMTVMVGFIVFIAETIFRFGTRTRSKKDNNSNIIIILIGFVLIMLSPLLSKLMQMSLSRKREFLADATAVEFTRNPQGLIDALRKLDENQIQMKNSSNATENLFIVSPLKSSKKKKDPFSTHPSIEDRIEALKNITV